MKIRNQQFLLVFIPVVVLLACFSVFFYVFQFKTIKKQVYDHVEAISEAKARRINGMISAAFDLISLPSGNTFLLSNVEKYRSDTTFPLQKNLSELLNRYVQNLTKFHKVYILSDRGTVIASSDPTCINRDFADNPAFKVSSGGRKFLDGFHFDEKKLLRIYLSAPLISRNSLIGVILIEYNSDDIISISSDYTGLGKTGETLLAEYIGGKIYFLVPLRHDPDAALKRFLPPGDSSYPMYKVLHEQKGVFEARDYRGVKVIAAGRYINESKWGIVTKIDYDEAMKPLSVLNKALVIFFLFALMIAAVISLVAGNYIASPLNEFIRSSNEIKDGDLSKRVVLSSKNELGILARSFNEMAGKLSGKIEKTERFSAQILNMTASGIVVLKAERNERNEISDFIFVMVNKATEKITGKKSSELTGKSLLKTFPALQKKGLFPTEVTVAETGQSASREFYYDEDGYNTWVQSDIYKFEDGLIVTLNDITERKRSELRIQESEAILKQAQQLSRVGHFLWTFNPPGLVWSDEMYRIHGYEPGELEFGNDLIYRIVYAEDVEFIRLLNLKYIEGYVENYEYEYRLVRKNGSVGFAIGKVEPVVGDDGKLVKVIGVVQDITDLKLTELELRKAKNDLEEYNIKLEKTVEKRTEELSNANENLRGANAELEKFAYIVSHDLKAPLSAFEGLLTLLKEYAGKPLGEEGKELVSLMEGRVTVMKDLITDILASTRKQKRIKEPLNLYMLVRQVINTLNPPQHFHFFVQHNLPEVVFNKSAMMQILQNLIANAIKYMDKNHPLIKIRFRDAGNFYQICVEDNGTGISADKLSRIFNLFEVAHTSEKIESYGIGLSIVKRLVEENGGNVWVESVQGEGSHFHFTVLKE
jgi:PAS domain S-box-containing protein